MDEKKYLNEERYQKTKKKISLISLLILLFGLLIGGGLIATGIIKTNNAKEKDKIELVEVESKIDSLNSQLKTMSNQISQLEIEQRKIFTGEGFSDNYYEKQSEMKTILSDKADIQKELGKLESKKFDLENSNPSLYMLLCFLGGFIVIASLMMSLFVFLISKRREIAAFTAQQTIPIAKEGLETMSPTIGNVAKDVASGIKEGINNNKI